MPNLGLTSHEAHTRLLQYGANQITDENQVAPLPAFLLRFKNPLTIILIIAAFVSGIVGDSVSAIIIISIVILSVILDYVNTYKSEKAVEALKERVKLETVAIRDGKMRTIKLQALVPGDVVLLKAGNVVPADGTVIEEKDLFVNESSLTGESFPQTKNTSEMLYMGSSITSGTATMLVHHTGRATRFSHIALSLGKKSNISEFDREIGDFSRFISLVTSVFVVIIFIINLVLKHNLLDSLLFSLALAVGLTPSLLPLIITLNLTKGSLAMAKRGVIVKRLSAIQNFGSIDILCTDKTGTLTEDKIEVVKYVNGFGETSEAVFLYAYLASYHTNTFEGPLDKAIRSYRKVSTQGYTKLDEIPFDFKRKRDSMAIEHNRRVKLITKGAPEEVLSICRAYHSSRQTLHKPIAKKIMAEFERLSREGFRVLAVAEKDVPKKAAYEPDDEVYMTFMGFIAFLDPPKKSVVATLRHMEEHGIEIKVVTGDNLMVSEHIVKEIALPIKGVLTGPEIKAMSDEALLKKIDDTTIFARVTPDEKERIITLLQKRGHVVGYLGDGINDAPSLKAADVGLSVSNAVDVARDSADFILMHKSLSDLVDAIVEGRKTFANTLKYLMMSLSSNFGNMVSIAGASFLLPFLPMLPVQILLNNLLYDASQFAIPLDTVDSESLKKPHQLNIKTLKHVMWVFGLTSSIYDFITFAVLYFGFHFVSHTFQTGWFLESLATQTLVVYVIRTKKVPFITSSPSAYLILTTIITLALALTIIFSPLALVFGFTPLSLNSLAAISSIVLVYLLTVEVVKSFFYRYYAHDLTL